MFCLNFFRFRRLGLITWLPLACVLFSLCAGCALMAPTPTGYEGYTIKELQTEINQLDNKINQLKEEEKFAKDEFAKSHLASRISALEESLANARLELFRLQNPDLEVTSGGCR